MLLQTSLQRQLSRAATLLDMNPEVSDGGSCCCAEAALATSSSSSARFRANPRELFVRGSLPYEVPPLGQSLGSLDYDLTHYSQSKAEP